MRPAVQEVIGSIGWADLESAEAVNCQVSPQISWHQATAGNPQQ